MLRDISVLILGCTHYLLVKQQVKAIYGNKTVILDPSDLAAQAVRAALEVHDLLRTEGQGSHQFYVSDITDSFVTNAKIFFGDQIKLEHYPMWE
jgi:glutamate racemase